MRQGESLERGILDRLKDAKMTEMPAVARFIDNTLDVEWAAVTAWRPVVESAPPLHIKVCRQPPA